MWGICKSPGGAQGGGGKGSLVCLHTCIRVHKHKLGAQKLQSEAVQNTPRLVVTSQRRENRYNRISFCVFECNWADVIKWDPPINVGVLDGGGQGPKQFR